MINVINGVNYTQFTFIAPLAGGERERERDTERAIHISLVNDLFSRIALQEDEISV